MENKKKSLQKYKKNLFFTFKSSSSSLFLDNSPVYTHTHTVDYFTQQQQCGIEPRKKRKQGKKWNKRIIYDHRK